MKAKLAISGTMAGYLPSIEINDKFYTYGEARKALFEAVLEFFPELAAIPQIEQERAARAAGERERAESQRKQFAVLLERLSVLESGLPATRDYDQVCVVAGVAFELATTIEDYVALREIVAKCSSLACKTDQSSTVRVGLWDMMSWCNRRIGSIKNA